MGKQNRTEAEPEHTQVSSTIHLSLQGKGGVGKSLIASILAQYLLKRGKPVRCVDTDPARRRTPHGERVGQHYTHLY